MTTDSVSDERLDQMICGFANVSALDRGARETTAALRELRSLRARVAVLESYFVVPGTTGKLYESSLDALRARHKDAVRLLRLQVSDDVQPDCRWDHFGNCQSHFVESPCRVAQARAFLAGESHDA